MLHRIKRVSTLVFVALMALALTAAPAFAQDPGGLGAGAASAATAGVGFGAVVALIILAAIIVYRLIKRFSS